MKANYFLVCLLIALLVFGLTWWAQAPLYAAIEPTDISGHWAEQQITNLLEAQILNGYPDNTFKPDKDVSRAEFVTMLNQVLKLSEEADVDFNDVNKADWFYQAIRKACAAQLLAGYGDGSIKPQKQVSRAEASVILSRALKLENNHGKGKNQVFTDAANIPKWAEEPINAVVSENIMTGYPDHSIRPDGHLTRAEAAAILTRVIMLGKSKQGPVTNVSSEITRPETAQHDQIPTTSSSNTSSSNASSYGVPISNSSITSLQDDYIFNIGMAVFSGQITGSANLTGLKVELWNETLAEKAAEAVIASDGKFTLSGFPTTLGLNWAYKIVDSSGNQIKGLTALSPH